MRADRSRGSRGDRVFRRKDVLHLEHPGGLPLDLAEHGLVGPPPREEEDEVVLDPPEGSADREDPVPQGLDGPSVHPVGGAEELEEDGEVVGELDMAEVGAIGEKLPAREEVRLEVPLALLDEVLEGGPFGAEAELAEEGSGEIRDVGEVLVDVIAQEQTLVGVVAEAAADDYMRTMGALEDWVPGS